MERRLDADAKLVDAIEPSDPFLPPSILYPTSHHLFLLHSKALERYLTGFQRNELSHLHYSQLYSPALEYVSIF